MIGGAGRWPVIDKAEVRRLHAEGLSFQKMADRLNTTRSAVAGVCRRLELKASTPLVNQFGGRKAPKSKLSDIRPPRKSLPRFIAQAHGEIRPPRKPNAMTVTRRPHAIQLTKAELRALLKKAVENT